MRSTLLKGSQDVVEQALSSSFSVCARQVKQLASPRVPQHVPPSEPPSEAFPPASESGGVVVPGTHTRSTMLQVIPGNELQSRSLWHWSAFFWEARSEHP